MKNMPSRPINKAVPLAALQHLAKLSRQLSHYQIENDAHPVGAGF